MNREMENLKAVALRYSGTGSPTVSSKGQGEYASQIVSMAKECGLYVHEDPVLLSQLESLKEGQSIPKELFVIIAEILSYSYLLQGKFPEHWKRKDGTDAINMKA